MAKTSFAKPGSAATPTKPPTKSTPGKPVAPAKPAAAKPAPSASIRAPHPARTGPAPAKRPPVKRPPGVRTNVAEEPETIETEVVTEETETDETPVEETPTDEAPSEAEEAGAEAIVPYNDLNVMSAPVGSGIGDLDAGDFEFCKFRVLQSNSPLVVEHGYSAGQLVVDSGDEAVILYEQDCNPVELTVLSLEKKFMEQLPFGNDEMPRIFGSAQEAKEAGLTPFGGDHEGYVPIAVGLVLIELPEGVEGGNAFSYEHGGRLFALALWQITGMAYKLAGRKLWTHLRGRLKGHFHTGGWTLETRLEKGKKNSYWVPVLKEAGLHDAEFVQFCEQVVNG